MATIQKFERKNIKKENSKFSALRTTIETVFYGNNVVRINSLAEAYELAKKSSGTIVTDLPVFRAEEIGLPSDAKILLYNDGVVTGRYAKGRVVIGHKDVDEKKYTGIAREAAFYGQGKKLYYAQAYIGLHEKFMVKAHFIVEEGYENTLYNWLLNFQTKTEEYQAMYQSSQVLDETDIYVLSLPNYIPQGHENGLSLFDSNHNSLLLCGMRYFGEHKKGTLTLAWEIANRNGYVSCHGGLKQYQLKEKEYTIAFFGLSGSGKSTLTHNTHQDKYEIRILHDDAFVISDKDKSTIALEPSYFDKTQDYPMEDEANQYLISVQNCGATLDEEGRVVLVTEDIRNGNGRAIKSKFWTKNRVNHMKEPVNAIVWLMRDSVIPPLLKIDNPVVASIFGATLATKRTTAERLDSVEEMEKLVIIPYANPFRTYSLGQDYHKFKALFEDGTTDCYILNTGHFMGKKIPKETTLHLLEQIVDGSISLESLGKLSHIQYAKIDGFLPNMEEENYQAAWENALSNRLQFVTEQKGTADELPEEVEIELNQLKNQVR